MKIIDHSVLKSIIKSKTLFRIGGLDIGSKYVGVAVSDETRTFSSPLKRDIIRKNSSNLDESYQSFSHQLQKVVEEHRIYFLVIGLPIYQGKLTPLGNEIFKMISSIEIPLSIPRSGASLPQELCCTFWDEYNTSNEARAMSAQLTQRRNIIQKQKDGLAAAIILDSFIRFINLPSPS